MCSKILIIGFGPIACLTLHISRCHNALMLTSATTLVSVWNSGVFQTALTALTEPHTCRRRITRILLHTYLLYFAPAMWWHIRTVRMTTVLHSSQWLQLCCSCLHNTWQCLCLSSANSHILPLRYCYISDAALSLYMFSFEIWSLIASVSNGSKFPVRFRVRFQAGTRPLQRVSTKNPAFQIYYFGSN